MDSADDQSSQNRISWNTDMEYGYGENLTVSVFDWKESNKKEQKDYFVYNINILKHLLGMLLHSANS